MLIATGAIRSNVNWPSDASSNTVLISILLVSLLQVLFAVLDVVIGRGASISYKDFKIVFGKVERLGLSDFTIPTNIVMAVIAVTDSSTSNILETLKQVVSSGIIIVNLEDRHAWWETRLRVLVSGAERLRKPDKIVLQPSLLSPVMAYIRL